MRSNQEFSTRVARGQSCAAVLLATVILFSASAFGQEQNTANDPTTNVLYSELTKVPQKAAIRRNPLENDPQAVAAGGKLFSRHCAECHGQNAEGGRGNKKGPSLLASEVQQATPGTLFWLLTNGVVRRGMPVWSKLPEPQRWQIVSYIQSLSGSTSKEGRASQP
jgi:mono/diheme cytochrome c family protein